MSTTRTYDRPTVREAPDGTFQVTLRDQILANGFPTHGAAWRWLDRTARRESWVRSETANWTGAGVYHQIRKP